MEQAASKPFVASEDGSGGTTVVSYQDMYERTTRLLRADGGSAGDGINLHPHNWLEFDHTWFDMALLGAVTVPTNSEVKHFEPSFIVKDFECKKINITGNNPLPSVCLAHSELSITKAFIVGDLRDDDVAENLGEAFLVSRQLSGIDSDTALGMIDKGSPSGATGHPVTNVSCGVLDGLPVGLMVVGQYLYGSTLLRLAYSVHEKVTCQNGGNMLFSLIPCTSPYKRLIT